MQISTKGHYGLLSLIDVALNQAHGPVTLNDIAMRQSLSVKYLWQVLNPLKASGFLKTTRGAKGGYVLARQPENITMLDVLTTLEGPISILKCVTHEESCPRVRSCVGRTVWADVNQTIEKVLADTTLAKLLCRHRPSSEIPPERT